MGHFLLISEIGINVIKGLSMSDVNGNGICSKLINMHTCRGLQHKPRCRPMPRASECRRPMLRTSAYQPRCCISSCRPRKKRFRNLPIPQIYEPLTEYKCFQQISFTFIVNVYFIYFTNTRNPCLTLIIKLLPLLSQQSYDPAQLTGEMH